MQGLTLSKGTSLDGESESAAPRQVSRKRRLDRVLNHNTALLSDESLVADTTEAGVDAERTREDLQHQGPSLGTAMRGCAPRSNFD